MKNEIKNEIIILDEKRQITPTELFTPEGIDPLIEEIEKMAGSFVQDMTTKEGREEIKSRAYKVSQTKSALDKCGKDLTEEWRQKTNVVNAERKKINERLDALRDKIRKPLTEFEEREKKKIEDSRQRITQIEVFKSLRYESINQIVDANKKVQELAEYDWDLFETKAKTSIDETILYLDEEKKRVIKQEEEKAELEKLRKEKEARDEEDRIRLQKENEDRIAKEAAEKATKEAEEKALKEKQKAEQEAKDREDKLKAEKEDIEKKAKETLINNRINQLYMLGLRYNADAGYILDDINVPIIEVTLFDDKKWIELINKITIEIDKRKKEALKKEQEEIVKKAVKEEKARADLQRQKDAEEMLKKEKNIKHQKKIHGEIIEDLLNVKSKFQPTVDVEYYNAVIVAIAKGEVRHTGIKY